MKHRLAQIWILLLLALDAGGLRAATTILAATENGPMTSTDGGMTWKVLPVSVSGLLSGQPSFHGLAVDPRHPSTWYAHGYAHAYGLFKTTDSGQTWTSTAFVGYSPVLTTGSIAIDPVETNIIYLTAGGSDYFLVKSTDSGGTWTRLHLPNTTLRPADSYPDGTPPQEVITDTRLSGVVYVISDAYILKSTDFGVTWSVLSSGVGIPDGQGATGGFPNLNRLDVDPRSSKILYASAFSNGASGPSDLCKMTAGGGQCGLYVSVDGGLTWTQTNYPAPGNDSLSVDPISGAIYAGGDLLGPGSTVSKSTDGGINWTPLKNGIGVFGPFVRVDPNSTNTIYAFQYFGSDDFVDTYYRSTDAGATWTSMKFPKNALNDLIIIPPAAVLPGPPTITADGIVNGASFAKGGLVPGEMASVFGTALTSVTGINLTSTLPLAKSFVNNSVLVNNQPAALFAVDNVGGQEQINFQVPWEVASGPNATVVVENDGVASGSVSVPVLAAQPGIFNYSVGTNVFGAILHANFQLADTAHPAKPGETVLIYCTGLGAVSSPPADGAAGNGQHTVTLPHVSIGGLAAHVSFSGLAPGFVGLYQINVDVPASLTAGNHAVVVTQVGALSNSVLLPVQ